MQDAGGFDDQVIKTFAEIAKDFMDNAESFDAANAILNANPFE